MHAEIAYDIRPRASLSINGNLGKSAADDAREKQLALIGRLAKPRHYRKRLAAAHEPDQEPKPGFMAGPTFYFEDRKSSVAMKSYCRYSKRPHGAFGQPCVRLEWTLKGKAAIERHLKGNKIEDLLSADLNRFANDNLLLEEVDNTAVGKLIAVLPLNSRRSPPVMAVPAVTANESQDGY